jgi:hypothetical protein
MRGAGPALCQQGCQRGRDFQTLEDLMKKRSVVLAVVGSVLMLVSGSLAQDREAHFSGLINDFSPSSVKGGPWVMNGAWSLDLHPERGTADFYAALTMSDYVITAGVVDPTQPGQNGHTHHIRLTNATVTWDMTGCPTLSPATVEGFQVNGTVSLITGNGAIAPFETNPPSSTLQICVTGANPSEYTIPNSNITLVFGGPAVNHFGSQAIHGVVRSTKIERDEHDRR